ncbi:hypothetical protein GCM10022261_28520 [Brevibacterium daeguense]|uniref:HNH nuclease domain-containing protein n=1 Tax=Brevibacterium daeguense TaxID=909936 RepID=A0ABP8EMT9_9MICO
MILAVTVDEGSAVYYSSAGDEELIAGVSTSSSRFGPSAEEPDDLARPSPVLATAMDVECVEEKLPELLHVLSVVARVSGDIRAGERRLAPEEALAAVRVLEDVRRRLDGLSAEATAIFAREGDPKSYGARNLRSLLREQLKLSSAEAGRRDKLAAWVGSRTGLTGEVLGPELPVVASGIHEAEFSTCQVLGTAEALRRLPPASRAAHQEDLEKMFADNLNSVQVKDIDTLGIRVLDYLDPDGACPREETHPDTYHVTVTPRRNGDWSLSGLLTATTGAALHAMLTDRAKADRAGAEPAEGNTADKSMDPRPGQGEDVFEFFEPSPTGVLGDGSDVIQQVPKDIRPDGVRRHERFTAIVMSGARERKQHGAAYALVISATAEQVAIGKGEATTQAGTRVRLEEVLNLSAGGQFYYHSTKKGTGTVSVRTEGRFATANQMAVLLARDRGCTFPDCDIPPGWCDAHHMIPYAMGGSTDINNLTLACSFHHHWHEKRGWEATMVGGLPGWIPPACIDPQRQPVFHSRFRSMLLELPPLLTRSEPARSDRTDEPPF